MVAISDQDFAAFSSESEDDLLTQLGFAIGGTDLDPQGATTTLRKAKSMAMPDWLDLGSRFFNRVWPQIKSIICTGYEEYTAGNKEWIEQAATALLALLNIGSAIAILLVKIAIKKGLDAICAV